MIRDLWLDFSGAPLILLGAAFFFTLWSIHCGGYKALFLLPLLTSLALASLMLYLAFYDLLGSGVDLQWVALSKVARAAMFVGIGAIASIVALLFAAWHSRKSPTEFRN